MASERKHEQSLEEAEDLLQRAGEMALNPDDVIALGQAKVLLAMSQMMASAFAEDYGDDA